MAEHQQNLNKPESAEQAIDPSADVIVIRFELDDHCPLPQCVHELLFNAKMDMEEENPQQGSPTQLGSRTMHDIQVETYKPEALAPVSGEDVTHSEATATAVSHSPMTPSRASPGRERRGSRSDLPPRRERINFFSGIPAVECIKGVLHLYKHQSRDQCGSSAMVCILFVPAHQQLSDMLTFLSPVNSTISSLRVIRDSTPNQYMLLIKFKDKTSTDQFFASYNGRRYNTLEMTVCQVVYVDRVEIKRSSQGASLVAAGLTELPSCPVCLERLDESVLTILCNHSFHTHCITQWEDTTCPVCRYTQIPEPSGDNTCSSCDMKEDLWICLICGNIGCGRYGGGHAHNHYVETQHTFAMQLGTQRVWDYIGDNYVHRLVQNKGDGKLVEVSGQSGLIADDEKIDSLQLEYTYLLTSQLESQRLFFEEKLTRVEKDANEQLSVIEVRCRSAVSDKEQLEEQLEREKKTAERKTQQLQTKLSKLTAELKEEKELNKCLSENQKLWKDRVEVLEKKIDITIQQKEQEMKELQEQVRDLMFYLETQKKIAESPDETRQEIQEGHLVVKQGAATGTSVTPSPRKGRKKK